MQANYASVKSHKYTGVRDMAIEVRAAAATAVGELVSNTGMQNKLQPLNFHPRMNKKTKIKRAQKKQRLREHKPSLVLAREVLQVARRKANNSTCRMGIAMLQDRLMDTSLCLRKRVCIMIIC